MPIVNNENSRRILASKEYPLLYVCGQKGDTAVSTEKPDEALCFQIPNLTAEDFGDPDFKKDYGLKYALYGGAMANGIAPLILSISSATVSRRIPPEP